MMLHKWDNGELVATCTVCGQTTRCCQALCPWEKSTTTLIEAVNAAPVVSDSPVERLPQRFRYRRVECHKWNFGVCYPTRNGWRFDTNGGGFGSFESDPWECLGHIIGDVEAFEWIDNDNGWIGYDN